MPEKDTEVIKEHHEGAFDFSFDLCKWMSDIIEPQAAKSYDVEKDNEMGNFMFTKSKEGGGMQYYRGDDSTRIMEDREGKGMSNMSTQDKFSMGILLLLYTLQVSMSLLPLLSSLLVPSSLCFAIADYEV